MSINLICTTRFHALGLADRRRLRQWSDGYRPDSEDFGKIIPLGRCMALCMTGTLQGPDDDLDALAATVPVELQNGEMSFESIRDWTATVRAHRRQPARIVLFGLSAGGNPGFIVLNEQKNYSAIICGRPFAVTGADDRYTEPCRAAFREWHSEDDEQRVVAELERAMVETAREVHLADESVGPIFDLLIIDRNGCRVLRVN